MAWYVGRRVLQMIPVFFGATLLVYALVFLLPGDPIAALGGNRPLAPGVAAQLRHTVPPGPAVLRAVPDLPQGHRPLATSGRPTPAVRSPP